MTWPTVSKGVFYDGYKNVKESPAPAERDMDIPNPKGGSSGVTNVRILEGSNKLTEENMRKPFG